MGRARYDLADPFRVNGVASMRFIAVMDEEVDAYGIIAGGQAVYVMSQHYDDQIETWLNGEDYQLVFTLEEVLERR